MLKKLFPIISLLFLPLFLTAQEQRAITGIVVEEDSSQPVIQAGVELLADRDSARLEVVVTDMDGKFIVRALPGDYILKISYIGCQTKYMSVHKTISQVAMDLGTIMLAHETLGLEASVVTAKAAPVTVKQDTVIYSAAAYNVAEDADLDELLKKIPGLEVSSSGGVTLHGRPIKELMVNGKRYFGGDVKTGLKNIPAAMVENIKAYDKPSDQARISGVEDGETEPVLDLSIKKSMMGAWQNNLTGGAGTSDRHYLRANANKMTKEEQQTVIASNHNTSGKASINATNRNQVGTGSSGDALYTNVGYTFSKENKVLKLAGHFQYTGTDRFSESDARSQSVQTSGSTFSNSHGVRKYCIPVIKSDFTVEWTKKPGFTFWAKAVLQYDENNSWSKTSGRSFRSDPYELNGNPNDFLEFDVPGDPFEPIRVNGTLNTGNTSTSRYNGYLNLLWSFRSQKVRGRSFQIRTFYQLNGNNVDQTGNYLTRYYRISKNPDSLLVRSNYVSTRTRIFSSYLQLTFNTPVSKKLSMQVYIRPDLTVQSQGKNYYDIASVDPDWTVGGGLGRKSVIASLPKGYEDGHYDLFSADASLQRLVLPLFVNFYRYTRKYNFTVGVQFREQLSWLHCNGSVIPRQAFDVTPNLAFRYRFSKTNQLSFNLRSWMAGAPINSMLPITNGTNPLSISIGNPYLLSPSIINSNLSYNTSNKKKQNSFTCSLVYNNTMNAVASSTVYDPESGVRTTTPQNINGNWRATGSMAFTKTFRDTRFSITNQLGSEFQNNVSYLYNNKLRKDETNVISRLMLKDRFEGCFRNEWLETILNGGVEFTDESSKLRPEMSQQPVSYIAGVSVQFSFPWKMRLESDFTTTFQRGYSYAELNKDYHIWNAELSQRIMNGKATIRIGWYDILKSQDNLVRSLNASSRSIVLYNGVTSYVMLRFFYRFKL